MRQTSVLLPVVLLGEGHFFHPGIESLFRQYIAGRISRKVVIDIFRQITLTNGDLALIKDVYRKISISNGQKGRTEGFLRLIRVTIGMLTSERDDAMPDGSCSDYI